MSNYQKKNYLTNFFSAYKCSTLQNSPPVAIQWYCLNTRFHSSCSHGGSGNNKDGDGDGIHTSSGDVTNGEHGDIQNRGGNQGDGKGGSGQWFCPKCGDPCTHLDTCACKLIKV